MIRFANEEVREKVMKITGAATKMLTKDSILNFVCNKYVSFSMKTKDTVIHFGYADTVKICDNEYGIYKCKKLTYGAPIQPMQPLYTQCINPTGFGCMNPQMQAIPQVSISPQPILECVASVDMNNKDMLITSLELVGSIATDNVHYELMFELQDHTEEKEVDCEDNVGEQYIDQTSLEKPEEMQLRKREFINRALKEDDEEDGEQYINQDVAEELNKLDKESRREKFVRAMAKEAKALNE